MRRFRINDTRLQELCAKGLNVTQIAGRLGVSTTTVYYAIKRLGLTAAAAPNGKTNIYVASST